MVRHHESHSSGKRQADRITNNVAASAASNAMSRIRNPVEWRRIMADSADAPVAPGENAHRPYGTRVVSRHQPVRRAACGAIPSHRGGGGTAPQGSAASQPTGYSARMPDGRSAQRPAPEGRRSRAM